MRLQRVVLYYFNDQPQKEIPLTVPKGSVFRSINISPEGICVWYEVPEIDIQDTTSDIFYILKSNETIPEKAEFVAVLDTIILTEEGKQAIVYFPIYKKIQTNIIPLHKT